MFDKAVVPGLKLLKEPLPDRPPASRRFPSLIQMQRQAGPADVSRADGRRASLGRAAAGGRLLKREAVGAWIRRQADRDGNRPRVFRELEPGSGIRIEIPYLLFTDSCRTGDGLSWKAHRVPVWASDGVLDDLRLVSKRLESEFPWELESATTFVLTGEPPTVSRITGQIKSTRFLRARSRITMTIDPTVTPQEVMESYKRGRDRLLGKRRRYRCIGEKSLRLALFTAEQPENYTHRQQMEKWNKRHPKWRHEEPKVFGRAQRDVMRLLLEPFAIRKAFAADVPASQKEK